MKLYVWDMMPFEEKLLEKIKEESKDEIVLSKEHLTMDNINLVKGFDGISVLGYSKITQEILLKLKEFGIRGVSTRTIGYDHMNVEKAKEIGISLYNAHYNPNNVADFTVMLMLIMLRKAKISICRALVNDFSLDGMMGKEMRSMKIGIIGTGKIGATVIKNLSGFGCEILAYDSKINEEIKEIAEYVELDKLYKESDIISLHIPLLEENYHIICKDSIKKMKPGVILINTARGGLINSEDLIEALEQEHVGGVAVDTLEEEMGIMHVDVGTRIINKRSLLYLKQFPNVLYTQHYAFYTEEAVASMVSCGIEALQEGLNGRETKCEIKG